MAVGITKLKISTLLFGSEVPGGLLSLSLDSGPKCQLKASFSSFVEFLTVLNTLVMPGCCRPLPCPCGCLLLRQLRLGETATL